MQNFILKTMIDYRVHSASQTGLDDAALQVHLLKAFILIVEFDITAKVENYETTLMEVSHLEVLNKPEEYMSVSITFNETLTAHSSS